MRRPCAAVLLAALLVLGAPGLGPWSAFAQTVVRAVPQGASAPVFAPAGFRLPSSGELSSTPAALLGPTILPTLPVLPALRPHPGTASRPEAASAASFVPGVQAVRPGSAAAAYAAADPAAPAVLPAAADEPGKTETAMETLSAAVKGAHSAPAASLRLLFDRARRGVEDSEEAVDAFSPEDFPPSGLTAPARGPRGLKGAAAVLREMAYGQAEVAPLLQPYRRQMNAARLMLIAKAGLSTALSYSVGALVDAAIAGSFPSVMLWLGALAAVTVVKAVTQRFYAVVSSGLRERLRRDFRVRLFEVLLRTKDTGEDPAQLASRLTVDVNRVTVKNVTIPIQFPHLVIQFALATGFVLYSSPLIAAVALVTLPLLGWLSWRYGRRSAAMQERAATQGADTTRIAAEHLAHPPADAAGRDAAVAGYREGVDGFLRTMLDLFRIYANFDALREVLQAAFTDILVLGVGLTSFLLTGAPTVGHVMSLRGYAKDLRGAVDGLLDAYTDGKEAEGGTRRILELLRGEPTTPPAAPAPAAGR